MRSLKILIFNMLMGLCLVHSAAWAQSFCFRTGIYDFTGNSAREFYKVAAIVSAGANIWTRDRIHLSVSSGLGFNSVRYNDHRHNLYMIPVFADMNFDLLDSKAKIIPTLGLGMILVGKIDQNTDLGKTYLALTYGYRATGGLRVSLKKGLRLTIDLSYNLVLPPESEEINISGVMTMIGIEMPFSAGGKEKKIK
jgi:hypothetical protein